MKKLKEVTDKKKTSLLKNIDEKLTEAARELGYSLEQRTKKMKQRDKKVWFESVSHWLFCYFSMVFSFLSSPPVHVTFVSLSPAVSRGELDATPGAPSRAVQRRECEDSTGAGPGWLSGGLWVCVCFVGFGWGFVYLPCFFFPLNLGCDKDLSWCRLGGSSR